MALQLPSSCASAATSKDGRGIRRAFTSRWHDHHPSSFFPRPDSEPVEEMSSRPRLDMSRRLDGETDLCVLKLGKKVLFCRSVFRPAWLLNFKSTEHNRFYWNDLYENEDFPPQGNKGRWPFVCPSRGMNNLKSRRAAPSYEDWAMIALLIAALFEASASLHSMNQMVRSIELPVAAISMEQPTPSTAAST